jgi:GH15 family glucan-1,4-alpha-glucosidase
MAIGDTPPSLVRLVVGLRGRVAVRVELVMRMGYGAIVPWVTKLDDGALRAIAGPDMLVLRTPVGLVGRDMKTSGVFEVTAGETVPFVLGYASSHLAVPEAIDVSAALEACERFWTGWTKTCHGAGPYSAVVQRSLVTLKALSYAPTGGIVAAPTTSLPEKIGGARNWDYRFCWLRDATFTMLALMNAGYFDEANAWRDWLVRAVAGSPRQLQILYGLAGERRVTEIELPWLPGYEGSQPVRIGNKASEQLQLDVYGEVMDALYQGRRGGLDRSAPAAALQLAFLEHLETIWREPDESIWEMRGPPRQFTYSKVMAWVAFNRALKSVEAFGGGDVARTERWRAVAAEIHDDVCRNGFDADLGSFVQSYGEKNLDASLLLMPVVGFLPASDARIAGTIAAIEKGLMADGFVMRYDTAQVRDGVDHREGVFLACSFWLVDGYMLQGRTEDARTLFERLLALGNDVGLFSEEYDTTLKRQLGNFPQAFTHVALTNSAFNLTRASRPVQQRADGDETQSR